MSGTSAGRLSRLLALVPWLMARDGVTHLAMEASSHGLDQRRLDGVRLIAAGFTKVRAPRCGRAGGGRGLVHGWGGGQGRRCAAPWPQDCVHRTVQIES